MILVTRNSVLPFAILSPRRSIRWLVCGSFLVLALGATLAGAAPGQSTSFPSWASTSQGRNDIGGYLAPEYSGAHAGFVRQFLRNTTSQIVEKTYKLQGSVASGVLAFWDRRSTPRTKSGIDSGLSRVYGIRRLGATALGAEKLLITGWDSTTTRAVLKQVVIPTTGSPLVQAFGPPAPANQIWVNSGLVNGMLYIFDLQSLMIRRRLDNDNDGIPETLDTAFEFYLDPTKIIIAFWGFGPSSSGLVTLLGRTRALPRWILKETPSGLALETVPQSAPVQVLQITGPLFAGQRRVRVRGPASQSFRIRESTGAVASGGWLSKTFALPRSGHMIVDLDTAVEGTWKLEIVPADPQQPVSGPTQVTSEQLAALFKPLDKQCNQGTIIRFDGDGFRNSHEARCLLDGSVVPLTTRYVSATQIDITLPARGDTSQSPPYTGAEIVKIWLVDTQSGSMVTDRVSIDLLFAP